MRKATAGPPVRLLLFSDNFERGGSQSQLIRLANSLEEDPEFEVHFGCIHDRGGLRSALALPESRVCEFPLRRFYGTSGIRQMVRLARYTWLHRIRLVQAQDFYANVICTGARLLNPAPSLIVSRRYLRLTERRLHRFGERCCYRLASRVVMNSAHVAREMVRAGMVAQRKLVVVPNGLDIDFYACYPTPPIRRLDPGRPARVGIVGRFHPVKGHAILLTALARIVTQWPHIELVMVGDGELRGQLESRIEELGLERRVRLVGAVEDVRPWMATFDVALLASHREGLPNALLEYLAMGRPVLATDVGGIRDVIEDGRDGRLVPPDDPRALADALAELLADRQARTRMSEAARRRARDYDLTYMVSRMRDLYRELTLRERGARSGGVPELKTVERARR